MSYWEIDGSTGSAEVHEDAGRVVFEMQRDTHWECLWGLLSMIDFPHALGPIGFHFRFVGNKSDRRVTSAAQVAADWGIICQS